MDSYFTDDITIILSFIVALHNNDDDCYFYEHADEYLPKIKCMSNFIKAHVSLDDLLDYGIYAKLNAFYRDVEHFKKLDKVPKGLTILYKDKFGSLVVTDKKLKRINEYLAIF